MQKLFLVLSCLIFLTTSSVLFAAEDHNGSRSNTTESKISTPIDIVDIESDAQSKSTGFHPLAGAALGIASIYRCEDGRAVEDSADCGSQMKFIKYIPMDVSGGDLDELPSETFWLCQNGDAVQNLSDCGDNVEIEDITIAYIPEDDFYRIEGHQGLAGGGAGKAHFQDLNLVKKSDCLDCGDQIKVKTAAGPLALGLGAIIAVGAILEDTDDGYETVSGSKGLGLGAIILVGAIVEDTDEEITLQCKINKIEEKNIQCELISLGNGGGAGKATFKELSIKKHEGSVEYFEDQDRLKEVNAPCTGPEDTSPGCDGVAAIKIQDGEDRLTENISFKAKGEDRIEESTSLRAEKREETKEARKDYISTYKGVFVTKIGNRLDNIPAKNLEKALEKINAKIEKTEENKKMSDSKKESYMDALFALLEIVEDKIGDIKGE